MDCPQCLVEEHSGGPVFICTGPPNFFLTNSSTSPFRRHPCPASRCFIECKYGCRAPGFGNYLWPPATSPQENTYSLTMVF